MEFHKTLPLHLSFPACFHDLRPRNLNIRHVMAQYATKQLPPIPEPVHLREQGLDRSVAPRPLILPRQYVKAQEIIRGLQHQISQLQEQNEALCRFLRAGDAENFVLQQQISSYNQYIKTQDEGLAKVIKTICSAFQGYRETVVEATDQAATAEETMRMTEADTDSRFAPKF